MRVVTTPRVVVLAGLFVAGGLVGAGAAALVTAGEQPADLIAGGQLGRGAVGQNAGMTVTVDVYNAGERSVSVEPVAIGGWDAGAESAEVVAAAGETWTTLSFEVVPDCAGGAVGTLELMTDDVVRELDLTDDVVAQLDAQRRQHCGGTGIELDPVVEASTWSGDAYVLDIRLPGHGRRGLGDLTVVDAVAGFPYTAEADGLPVTLPFDGAITLTTRWTFDCDLGSSDPAEPTDPGGVISYEGIYLTTPDDVQIHADVSSPLATAHGRACDGTA